MVRTVVYPPRPGDPPLPPGESPDTVPDKLVKYLPAEVLAFYSPVYALDDSFRYRLGIFIVSLIGTLLYFLARADKAKPVRWFNYPLILLAFFGWALGTSTVGSDLFNWESSISKAAIPTAVLLIPLLDEALTKWLPGALQWP